VKKAGCARWKMTVLSLLPAIFIFAAGARAQSPLAASPVPPPPAYREVVDETGRAVRIPQPVRRIVSLAPSLTETVYALGLQDYLVGDTDFCDYPPDAQKKTKVGGAINPSIEEIVALKPDVVLAIKSLNRQETVRALDGLGISAYATDPHTVNDILTSTAKLADILGAPEVGASVAAELQVRLSDLQQHLEGISPRRVLFVVWTEPLISIGKSTFIADALRRAGAVSIVEAQQDWPQMSLEEVVHQQPEFLVFAASHSESAPNDFDAISTKPGWRSLDAIKNRHFVVISDAVNRPAPRIISAIEDLARQLHPEAFAEKPPPPRDDPKKSDPQPPRNTAASFLIGPNAAPHLQIRHEGSACVL
jgi:iron complex transport system substrate-binding protein